LGSLAARQLIAEPWSGRHHLPDYFIEHHHLKSVIGPIDTHSVNISGGCQFSPPTDSSKANHLSYEIGVAKNRRAEWRTRAKV
jgi:hypothetical protein